MLLKSYSLLVAQRSKMLLLLLLHVLQHDGLYRSHQCEYRVACGEHPVHLSTTVSIQVVRDGRSREELVVCVVGVVMVVHVVVWECS